MYLSVEQPEVMSVDLTVRDQRLVLETASHILMVEAECARHGEVSAVDIYDPEELDMFMSDLCNQCEYFPAPYSNKTLMDTISRCLNNAQEYLHCNFSPMQHYLWFLVAKHIITQAVEHGLQDTCRVNRYTYSSMMGLSLVMKLYE
jgi:hypothetical protein